MAKFRYLGAKGTHKNYVKGEVENRYTSGNVSYHSVQKLLPFRLISKDVKLRHNKKFWEGGVIYYPDTAI